MYTYTQRSMTQHEQDGVIIGLLVRAMVKYQKIIEQRRLECDSPKWQAVLKEVHEEVTEALLRDSNLKLIMQYTAELEALDVSEFFPKPKLQPVAAPVDKHLLERDHMLGHPTGERVYSFRRRVRQNNVKQPASTSQPRHREMAFA